MAAGCGSLFLLRLSLRLALGLSLSLASGLATAEIYKYKTKDGKWAFTDKKPKPSVKTQTIKYKHKTITKERPKAKRSKSDGQHQVSVSNPYFAPLEVAVLAKSDNRRLARRIIAAKTTEVVLESESRIEPFELYWTLGNPLVDSSSQVFAWPVKSKLDHKITQSFKGKFSHNKQPSLYAVDIALPIGTDLVAARSGVVVSADDNFVLSGVNKYFLDKANSVLVHHDDGTFADYAHLLQGTITVKPGERVEVGQVIGRSGTSGYSTGPHLHFVIYRNTGMDFQSIPFQFRLEDGTVFTPRARQTVAAP